MSDFERYIVIKKSDLWRGDTHYQSDEAVLREFLAQEDIPTRESVVVEADWPIYEEVWDMVQRQAEGRPQRVVELEAELEASHQRGLSLAADRDDLIKELIHCQNVLHQLAHAGEFTPEYADDARKVLQRVTGGQPPLFDDKGLNPDSLNRKLLLARAEELEALGPGLVDIIDRSQAKRRAADIRQRAKEISNE
jgi:hypothetical protein